MLAKTFPSAESPKELLRRAAEYITGRYSEQAAQLVTLAREAELQGSHRRVGASSDVGDNNVSNTGKIFMQLLFIHILEYGHNLDALDLHGTLS